MQWYKIYFTDGTFDAVLKNDDNDVSNYVESIGPAMILNHHTGRFWFVGL